MKSIIYSVFLQCSLIQTDLFWKDIFSDLCYGVAPYPAYIYNDYILCGSKGREFSYRIPDVHDEDDKSLYVSISNDVIDLFNNKLNIFSNSEIQRKYRLFQELSEEIREMRNTSWVQIRKKNIQDLILDNFIIEMKNKHGLSLSEMKRLHSRINMCLLFKTILPRDIEYSNGKIHSIKGVLF